MKLEAPTGFVAELFVKKGLAQDEEFAKKILQKNMQNKAKMVSVEDFNQIFCKNIFKDALIAITT
jgi:threonyl-tRNA synthetase